MNYTFLVHPKGNLSSIYIGRTDVEAETPILWPPDVKSWPIWEDPNAGKDWRWEEKRMTGDEMVGWYHWLSGVWAPVGDGQESWCAAVHGMQRVRYDWVTELNWTELKHFKSAYQFYVKGFILWAIHYWLLGIYKPMQGRRPSFKTQTSDLLQSNGKDFIFQCRGCGFHPWLGS